MRHIMKVFKWIGVKFLLLSKSVPGSMAGIFVVFIFFNNLFTKGASFAFATLAKTVFGAELIINENVHKAIIDEGYGFMQFFEIVTAFLVLYTLVFFIVKTQVFFTTESGSKFGLYLIAIFIVGIIEVSAIAVIDGTFGFVPIKDGIVFLFRNIEPVFANVF